MPLYAAAITVHVLAAVVWVGGMFFAYLALRPTAGRLLDPPLRLALWAGVFERFFPWVWATVVALLLSGYWIIFAVFGGFGNAGLHVHLMHALGLVMMLLFLHVYFAPFRRLQQAVAAQDWTAGGKQLNLIRRIIAVNLALGLLVVAIGSGGRYWY